jgi:hypothetical protein
VLTEQPDRATPAEDTDALLIERSRRDPGCFAVIFDRHAQEILRYAHARLGPDLAEDVTAETFLAAFLAAGGAPAGDALTIRPSRIPAGDSILIEVSWFPGDGRLGENVGDQVLGNDNPPTCTPAR